MTAKKLIGVERSILVYEIGTNLLHDEVLIDTSIAELIKVLGSNTEDPMFYDFYKLDSQKLTSLMPFINAPIKSDFVNFHFVLACFGLHEEK